MPRENIQNQLRAVNHPAIRRFLDVPLLHWRKIAIKNNQRRFVCQCFGADFIQLASPNQRRRIGGVSHLLNRAGHFSPGAARELHQLVERFLALFSRGHTRRCRSVSIGWRTPRTRGGVSRGSHEQGALQCGDIVLSFHTCESLTVIMRDSESLLKIRGLPTREALHNTIIRPWVPHRDSLPVSAVGGNPKQPAASRVHSQTPKATERRAPCGTTSTVAWHTVAWLAESPSAPHPGSFRLAIRTESHGTR